MLILLTWWYFNIWIAESAVLDPALHLFPSPPLTQTRYSIRPEELWSQPRVERNADDMSVIPIEEVQITTRHLPTTSPLALKLFCQSTPSATSTISPPILPSTAVPTTTEQQESMEKAETFWPGLRNGYGYGSIHIPLTFSLSGFYGRYGFGSVGAGGKGVIGSSYASVSDDSGIFGLYGKSGLAGSGYGTRIYGGSGGPAWSGWGNGKWGHYGKG